jgi:hypothetical protein
VIGRHRPSGHLRTANADYWAEYQPGPLLEAFNTTTNDDAGPVSRSDDERYRLYKVNRGDTLSLDYVQWPGDLGAPYVDVNGNGSWDQGVDRPNLRGDQMIWTVLNDVNDTLHQRQGATAPIGVELQTLFYSFDREGPLGNTMFIEWTLINKSDADYDSTFVGLFSDIDLGDAHDDLPGCDTTLALGYFYNGDDHDDLGTRGYGSLPPAIGFTILKGSHLNSNLNRNERTKGRQATEDDSLYFSSMVIMTNSFHELLDPRDGSPEYAPRAFNFVQGRLGNGMPLRRADSSIITFWVSGDPVAGTGDLPQNFPLGPFAPYDYTMLMNLGPLTLPQGDTIEIAAALVISQGANRLESVTLLKNDVAWVRDFYLAGGIVGVGEGGDALPKSFGLLQNYPNPFNPTTSIEYALPRGGHVALKVYNVLGGEVATLVDGEQGAGTFKTTWDASGLPSGVYFYRLTAGEHVQTRKMVLMK